MSSKLSMRAITACFVAVMALGLIEMVFAITRYRDLDVPTGWDNFRQGRLTTTLEKQLDFKLPQRDMLIAVANDLRYLLLRGSSDAVRVGRHGWLFLAEELQYDPAGASNLVARADLMQAVARHMQQQGITLAVALVPDKARIYGEELPAGEYPGYNSGRYAQVMQALHDRQVQAVDLYTPLRQASQHEEVYYRGDTHWNQRGAQIAAREIAAAVQTVALQPATRYETGPSGPRAPRTGDLVRMMGLDTLPAALRPGDDMEMPQQTQALQTPDAPAASLFGDASVPVTLLGTSYSQRANFQGALQQALSAQVLNMSQDGGGFLQAARHYYADDAFKSSPPRLIIWEVPERFFTQPLAQEAAWLKSQGW